MKRPLQALAMVLFLAVAHKAAADNLVMRYETGVVVLTSAQGDCPATYAEAVLTRAPATRLMGCWGLQGRTVWVFLPMRMPMSFSIDDFEVTK